jgi:hypothetical protein
MARTLRLPLPMKVAIAIGIEKVVLAKHGHDANQKAPDKLAALIETFYDTLLAS